MSDFAESYVGQLRKLVGQRTLIAPGIKAVIQDPQRRVLLVQRRDSQHWALPTGGLELGESIFECLIREVREETGLHVLSATPIAIYSDSRFAFTDCEGAQYQMLDVAFGVDAWTGSLLSSTSETVNAQFFALANLPELEPIFLEVLQGPVNCQMRSPPDHTCLYGMGDTRGPLMAGDHDFAITNS